MAPEGLVEVRVSWPEHPRYLQKKEGLEGKRRSVFRSHVVFLLAFVSH